MVVFKNALETNNERFCQRVTYVVVFTLTSMQSEIKTKNKVGDDSRAGLPVYSLICRWNYFVTPGDPGSVTRIQRVHSSLPQRRDTDPTAKAPIQRHIQAWHMFYRDRSHVY